jgi:hypothetical protein
MKIGVFSWEVTMRRMELWVLQKLVGPMVWF